jgi:hypothetical protein
MTQDKRDQYLRGIAASAPEVNVNPELVRQAILTTAFNHVSNPQDWKAPIHAIVTIHEYDDISLAIYCEAIKHFTATEPNIYVVDGFNTETRTATYRIVSEGYRLGPAGDH